MAKVLAGMFACPPWRVPRDYADGVLGPQTGEDHEAVPAEDADGEIAMRGVGRGTRNPESAL